MFTRGESAVRDVLRRATDSPKLGLFAHITWELCLDGALLRRVGTQRVLEGLRGAVASVRPDVHHGLAATLVRLPSAERPAFEARVNRILDAILAGPWVAGYATASGVVERLEGLRRRLGLGVVSSADRDVVADGLETLAPHADTSLDEIARSAVVRASAR